MMTITFASVRALMYIHPCVCIYCIYTLIYIVFIVCYLISEWIILDWVLCCQTDAAEQDEEEDEVGEDVVVDDLMAQNPESKKTKWEKRRQREIERIILESAVTKITGNVKWSENI